MSIFGTARVGGLGLSVQEGWGHKQSLANARIWRSFHRLRTSLRRGAAIGV